MKQPVKYLLQDDITSQFKSQVYGRYGEEVTLVADHGNVWIVEDQKGQRFPVPADKLIEKPPDENKSPPAKVTRPALTPSEPDKFPTRKTKKVIVNNQQNLF
jgi:hypothetical protein